MHAYKIKSKQLDAISMVRQPRTKVIHFFDVDDSQSLVFHPYDKSKADIDIFLKKRGCYSAAVADSKKHQKVNPILIFFQQIVEELQLINLSSSSSVSCDYYLVQCKSEEIAKKCMMHLQAVFPGRAEITLIKESSLPTESEHVVMIKPREGVYRLDKALEVATLVPDSKSRSDVEQSALQSSELRASSGELLVQSQAVSGSIVAAESSASALSIAHASAAEKDQPESEPLKNKEVSGNPATLFTKVLVPNGSGSNATPSMTPS